MEEAGGDQFIWELVMVRSLSLWELVMVRSKCKNKLIMRENLIQKWAKDLKTQFTKEDILMVKKQ